VLLCFGPKALAQRVPEQAATPPVPPGSPLPRILPPPLPSAALPAPKPAQPGATQVPKVGLSIRRAEIEGVTAYKAGTFAPLLPGLVGPAVPLAGINAARTAILDRYRRDGYVLTTVNAAVGADHVLRLIVIEGHISDVKLSGNIGPAGVQVLRFLRRLTEVRPIDTATLERYLLLAQDVPGVTLHAVLQPSQEPGSLTLIAQVSRKAVSGVAVFDNLASSYTGPVEGLTVLDLNSFTEFGEKTELSFYHAFPNSENFGQASTEFFVGSSGLKVKLYGGAGPAVPGGLLAQEGYFGYTTVFGAGLSYPIIRARQQTLNVTANFDALDSLVDTSASGTPARASYDSLRIIRVGADYARSDLLLGDGRPAINGIRVRLSHGLGILGASGDGDPDAPRLGEQEDFFKFDAQISRTQTVFYPWQNASVALMGLVAGQVTPDILPPAEKFYLGGLDLTRGYYEGEVSGDNALAATAELQLNTQFKFHRFGLDETLSPQFYIFYDWGETWENQSVDLNHRLASAGGGVRLDLTSHAELDLAGLARMNQFPTGTGPDIVPISKYAFYWRLLARF
jgi:hemolysin activation/secretion protein